MTERMHVWPDVAQPRRAHLSLTDQGERLRVAATYGVGSESTTIAVTLDVDERRQLADLAATVRELLDAGGSPSADAFNAARGTVRVAGGLVSVHARRLRVDGPADLAAEVFVASDEAGNYSVRFRRHVWAEIAAILA